MHGSCSFDDFLGIESFLPLETEHNFMIFFFKLWITYKIIHGIKNKNIFVKQHGMHNFVCSSSRATDNVIYDYGSSGPTSTNSEGSS